jgi:cation diffusion facilitator CzcD-associated flavoprotein CzcO
VEDLIITDAGIVEGIGCAASDGDRQLRVAVIGAGMSGIVSSIKLAGLGIEHVVFEKADRLGGTWRENTYPGLSCDVPAHSYTYSFARNPDWTGWFASGPEIQAYFERVADQYGVVPRIRFGDEVTELRYSDGGWDLRTASGHTDRFEVVIAATGVLHHPNVPHFEGIETFAGASFHTARWDHSVPLDGRRIGVIGTGSTAVQITSALVDRVERYALFQRTAQWVIPGEMHTYTDEERDGFRRDPAALEALAIQLRRSLIDTVAAAVVDIESPYLARIQERCQENLDRVTDPVLKAKLTPHYRAACKRLIFSGDFYEAVQHPNVDVVTSGIERIEPAGVRTLDGRLHELDVLVLATGFKADRFVRPIRMRGRDGIDLDDVWADGPCAHLSLTVPGFPNFFILNGPNGPVGNFSLIDVAEMQLGHVLALIEPMRQGRYREIEPTAAALDAFEAERRAAAKNTIWMTGCTSWYLDKEGVPAGWTMSYDRFREAMEHPDLDDYATR